MAALSDVHTFIADDIDALTAIIPRVSAMNSFLRSAAMRRGWNPSLPMVVYHYKLEVIARAINLGIACHRKAQIPARCRDCGGSGKYTDWSGFTHPHCYRCGTTGNVRLDFIETTLPGAVWLTPREKAWPLHLPDDLPETTENYAINQPGADLTPSQVADHMNAIEAFFPRRPAPVQWEYGSHDSYACYSIWIGATDLSKCHLCGCTLDSLYGGHVTRTGRLMWSAHVCKTCKAQHTGHIFTVLSQRMPEEFLTPEIRLWAERHPVSHPQK